MDKVEQSSKIVIRDPINQGQSVSHPKVMTTTNESPSLKLNILKGGDDGNSAANVLQAARLIPRALDDEGLAAGLDGRRGFCK